MKHFLQKRKLSKVTGYSILTKRTELNQVIPSGAPTYDDIIRESLRESKERTARLVSQRRCVENDWFSGSYKHTHTHTCTCTHAHMHVQMLTQAEQEATSQYFAGEIKEERYVQTVSAQVVYTYTHQTTSDTLNVFAGNCGSCCRHRKKWRALAMNWLNTGK